MKKILFVFTICVPSFAMEPDLSGYETRLSSVEAAVAEIQDVLEDKPNPHDATATIPGMKTKVKKLTEEIENITGSLQQNTESISTAITSLTTTVSSLSTQMIEMREIMIDLSSRMDNIDDTIDERMSTSWEEFIENKYREYMETKKEVLDIITACKVNGTPTPTYITETAAQLQELSLDRRRTALSDILTRLNIFASLLDSEKLEAIQAYLNKTSVPAPKFKEVKSLLPGIVVDGEYIRVYGATRTFTRSSGFKTGLPKQGWMDQSSDYFGYGLRPILEQAIRRENLSRGASNAAVEQANAMAQAAYTAGVRAAERMTFPADDLSTLITEYNRLLTRHEI